MFATFALWCVAAAPEMTFAPPWTDPAALNVGVPTTVLFLVQSFGKRPAAPIEVAVERVEAADAGVVVGQVNDSGRDGDAVAGDGLYSGRLELVAKTRKPLRLRAVASNGVASAIVEVPVLPKGAPTGLSPGPIGTVVQLGKNGPDFIADEVIVCFGDKVAFEAVAQTISLVKGRATGRFPGMNCYHVELPPTGKPQSVMNAIRALRGKPGVVSAEVNGVLKAF